MTLWIHRDGEFISTSTNGAWKADGTRRGILPPPRPTKIPNTTYDSQVSDAVIPYRTLRGNQAILDSARLYGPNGTGKQWDMFSKIPKSAWRAHRIFKDQADFEAHLLPA